MGPYLLFGLIFNELLNRKNKKQQDRQADRQIDRQTDRQTYSPERVTDDTEPTDEWHQDVLDEESNEGHGRVQVLWHPRSVTVVVECIV